MFSRRRHFLRLRLAVTDSAVTAIAFELAYILRQHLPAFQLFYLDTGTIIGLLFAAITIWLASGLAMGLYRAPSLLDTAATVRAITRQTIGSAATLTCLLYVLKLGGVSRLFMVMFVSINVVFLLAWRLSAPALGRLATGESARRHYVIVGTGQAAVEVARHIQSGGQLVEVVAFIGEEGEEPGATTGTAILAYGALSELLRTAVVDEVIFAVEHERVKRLERLFLTCQEEGVKVRVVLGSLFPMAASEVSLDRLHNLPLLSFSTAPDNDYLLFVKRCLDIVMALCMAALFAPFSLLVIGAIRLSSKGPIFYAQERCGLNGRRFRMYKFRSMYVGADKRRADIAHLNEMDGPVFKCAKDPRITPIGRILRRFSIDEWPQLLNVILGDMSLVGPRPPLPEEVEQYKPWQRRRLRMRPGLTCLWVLEGRNKIDFLNWMRLDLHYIDNWSLTLDWKILLQSIPHVLSGKGM